MRMPSTQSPWLPLACSLALHSLVMLGGWLLLGHDDRFPTRCWNCIDPDRRLTLTAIFDGGGGKGGGAPRPKGVSTKVDEPPPIDPAVQLIQPTEFNPVSFTPVEVAPPVHPPVHVGVSPRIGTSTPGEGGSPSGQSSGAPPGPSFFQVATPARSVVYVIDRSGSMGPSGALRRAREELVMSLRRLPPKVLFQVLVYNNQEPQFLVYPERLLPAQPDAVERAVQALDELRARGETNHFTALSRALFLSPEVIYFVTDGQDLSPKDVTVLTSQNGGRTTIHVIELVRRREPLLDGPLVQLAHNNRGIYRCLSPEQ
jgi:hypothetical protein